MQKKLEKLITSFTLLLPPSLSGDLHSKILDQGQMFETSRRSAMWPRQCGVSQARIPARAGEM
jgi:hypothetical protein